MGVNLDVIIVFIKGVILSHQIRHQSIRPFSGTRQVFIEIIVFVNDLFNHKVVSFGCLYQVGVYFIVLVDDLLKHLSSSIGSCFGALSSHLGFLNPIIWGASIFGALGFGLRLIYFCFGLFVWTVLVEIRGVE